MPRILGRALQLFELVRDRVELAEPAIPEAIADDDDQPTAPHVIPVSLGMEISERWHCASFRLGG